MEPSFVLEANGEYQISGLDPGEWAGIVVAGTDFGSGTVSVQWADSAGDYHTYEEVSFTAAGSIEFACFSTVNKLVLSGATGPEIPVVMWKVDQTDADELTLTLIE
jgi:hypothetical protein